MKILKTINLNNNNKVLVYDSYKDKTPFIAYYENNKLLAKNHYSNINICNEVLEDFIIAYNDNKLIISNNQFYIIDDYDIHKNKYKQLLENIFTGYNVETLHIDYNNYKLQYFTISKENIKVRLSLQFTYNHYIEVYKTFSNKLSNKTIYNILNIYKENYDFLKNL